MNPYAALLINAALCALVATLMLFMSRILGRRHGSKVKYEIFETGNPPIGSLRGTRFPVKFYLTAIIFIIFDIEVVFMYPRCVSMTTPWSVMRQLTPLRSGFAVPRSFPRR